uniref:Uncharacterized protein n=1 Tax=Anguilla anguilla TaxID=7936 RepID=A0A0E9XW81_ANGAN
MNRERNGRNSAEEITERSAGSRVLTCVRVCQQTIRAAKVTTTFLLPLFCLLEFSFLFHRKTYRALRAVRWLPVSSRTERLGAATLSRSAISSLLHSLAPHQSLKMPEGAYNRKEYKRNRKRTGHARLSLFVISL